MLTLPCDLHSAVPHAAVVMLLAMRSCMCCGMQRKSLPGKSPGKDWFQVATMRDFEQGKRAKPMILANNQVRLATCIGMVLCVLTLPCNPVPAPSVKLTPL